MTVENYNVYVEDVLEDILYLVEINYRAKYEKQKSSLMIDFDNGQSFLIKVTQIQ